MLPLDGGEPADPRGNEHADPRRDLRGDLQTGIVDRELRRRDRVLDEDVHLLDVLLLDPAERIEPAHLAGDPRGELRCVELGDRADAAAAADERLPVRVGADPERRHQADARDDDSPIAHDPPYVKSSCRQAGSPAWHDGAADTGAPTSWSWRAIRCTRPLP